MNKIWPSFQSITESNISRSILLCLRWREAIIQRQTPQNKQVTVVVCGRGLGNPQQEAIDSQGNKKENSLFSQQLVQNSSEGGSFQEEDESPWSECQLPPSFHKGELKRRLKTSCSQEKQF